MPRNFLFTSESVSEGHPDKIADRISDAILDDLIKHEPEARVGAETMVMQNTVVLGGEFRAEHTPDYDTLVRDVIRDIGYKDGLQEDFDAAKVDVVNRLHGQSPEIAQGVDENGKGSEGAGDQGMMFGFASNETESFMPAPIHYCHRMMEALANKRKNGDSRLGPDAKCQLTIKYVDRKPVHIENMVVSHQHKADVSLEDLRGLVYATCDDVLPEGWVDQSTELFVNPTGSFIQGGPGADAGLTGRKIIVDTYGGFSRHGGGAFSGKDPTKVDRSAAYAARYVAKNIIAADLAEMCEIQLCYAIGVAEPLAIYLDTFGTAKNVKEDQLIQAVRKSISLTPRGIREHLQLNKPIYGKTSNYGHFGRDYESDGAFSWEKTDLADELLRNL